MGEIFVLVEHRQGTIRDITHEMLAAGEKLASQQGASSTAVLLGHHVKNSAPSHPDRTHGFWNGPCAEPFRGNGIPLGNGLYRPLIRREPSESCSIHLWRKGQCQCIRERIQRICSYCSTGCF